MLVGCINEALEQYFVDHNKEAHINRQHIYRMLSSKGNPSVDNIGSLLNALGLQLKVEACAF
ncbi:DNA-binding protein [Rickettsia montanensis]|uniref:helix-turn-helix domain-containing transcriptional regulator n=1 Tax=Rickettsia montanensis TaxID=33991 RepID=UPI00397A2977